MATSVLVEPLSNPADIPSAILASRSGRVCLLAVFALVAIAIEGYHPYAEDGGLYAAGVQHLLDPALFPQWTAFVLAPMRVSEFAPLIAALVRLTHLALPAILLLIHGCSVFATLLSGYGIATVCWSSMRARFGAVLLLACWLGLPVAGTSLVLMDPYVTARSFSTPCMLLALFAVLRLTTEPTPRRRLLWLAVCVGALGFGTLMHPLMAGYGIAAVCLLACIRARSRSARLRGILCCCAAALLLAAALEHLAPPESPAYVAAALSRTYWFPGEWHWYELAGLAAPLLLLGLGSGTRLARLRSASASLAASSAAEALAQMAVLLGTTAILVCVLYVRPDATSHLVARLQPLRAFQIVYFVLILRLGALLGTHLLDRGILRPALAVLLLGGPIFAGDRATFPSTPHIQLSAERDANPWVQSFEWARSNTPKDALFALDPDYIHAPGEDAQCFRAIALRSALPDYSKDGGEASITPQLADLWQAGLRAQQSLSSRASSTRRLRALGVSWVILRASEPTDLACPFSNYAAKVCRIS